MLYHINCVGYEGIWNPPSFDLCRKFFAGCQPTFSPTQKAVRIVLYDAIVAQYSRQIAATFNPYL